MKTFSPSEGLKYLESNLTALRRHHDKSSKGSTLLKAELRHLRIDPTTAHVQIWWVGVPSMVAREFAWDAFDLHFEQPEHLAEFLRGTVDIHGLSLSEADISLAIRRPPPEVPLFRYQPQRYRALVPLAKRMAQLAQGSQQCMFTHETLEAAMRDIATNSPSPASSLLRPRIENPNPRPEKDAAQLGMFFAEFNRCGRQIFDMPSALIERFRLTDVDDIPFDALRLPYESFYLYFGPQLDLETVPGWHPDGAYISTLAATKHIQMLLTSAPPDIGTYAMTNVVPEPVYIQVLTPEKLKVGVGEATEMAFAERMKELREQMEGGGPSSFDEQNDGEELDLPDGMEVVDVSKEHARQELSMLPAMQAAWRETLKLVVNALAYLSAYPDDIELHWPENTPQTLYSKSQDGTPKQQHRAKSKLASLGFTAIHMCGLRFSKQTSSDNASTADARNQRPTWVRGHWVRQAYGPQWSLRRLQWRMPHLRNASEIGKDDPSGHIYLVT